MIKKWIKPVKTFGSLGAIADYLQGLEKSLEYFFSELLNRINLTGTATWNPTIINNGAQASTTVTVTGAAIGDPAIAGFSSVTAAGWIISASVTSANTVTVTLMNHTGGNVDLASGTVTVIVMKG